MIGLIQCGAITTEGAGNDQDTMSDGEQTTPSTSDEWTLLQDNLLPTFDEYQIGIGGAAGEKMWELAEKCLVCYARKNSLDESGWLILNRD
jgi:hypothetical protein